MGKRKITIRESVSDSIAAISWYIESKGKVATAQKFSDAVYDAIEKLADDRISYPPCSELERNILGLKCKPFRRKYTIVFYESATEIIIHEFIPSKLITW